jgi:putative ABC transport system permease protein
MLSPEASLKNRERASLEEIQTGEGFLGAEAARLLGMKAGEKLRVGASEFKIAKVLEEMGSVDDLRVFVHLHQAQEILKKGRVINAIELIGCGCERDLAALGGKIEKMLPGVKTRTITQIARTQRETVRLMEKFTFAALLVVLFVGWGLISNAAAANVLERRREIGILMAMGAVSRFVFLFLIKKAAALGLAGGLGGFFIGTFFATRVGPRFVDLGIEPQMEILLWSLPGTVALTVIFSWLPASRASRTDPALLLMED